MIRLPTEQVNPDVSAGSFWKKPLLALAVLEELPAADTQCTSSAKSQGVFVMVRNFRHTSAAVATLPQDTVVACRYSICLSTKRSGRTIYHE